MEYFEIINNFRF